MKKILFNANIFSCFSDRNSNRSGIYMVACDLLSELMKREDLDISFYCDQEFYQKSLSYFHTYYPDARVLTLSEDGLRSFLAKKLQHLNGKRSLPAKVLRRVSRCSMNLLNRLYQKRDRRFFEGEHFDIAYSVLDVFPECIHGSEKILTVTTIHDLIPYVLHEFELGPDYWLFRLFNERKPSDRYICISEATKKDMLQKFPDIPEEHVTVTYNGVSDRFRPVLPEESMEILQKYHLESGKYMFSIGSLVPHKNLKMQISAFSSFVKANGITDFSYAVAGGSLAGRKNELLAEAEDENIVFLGYVPDEDVPVLYSNALFCSFTSLYEGFGLPAVEAMRCSCPLVSSNRSSLPEVCGDAAILIDPESKEAHEKAYRKLYNQEELRKELREKGFIQAAKFNWKEASDIISALFSRLEG